VSFDLFFRLVLVFDGTDVPDLGDLELLLGHIVVGLVFVGSDDLLADEPLLGAFMLTVVLVPVIRQIVNRMGELTVRSRLQPLAAGRRLDQQPVWLLNDLAVDAVLVILIDESARLVICRYDLTVDTRLLDQHILLHVFE